MMPWLSWWISTASLIHCVVLSDSRAMTVALSQMITVYKWCTAASGTFKYVVPRLTCHHKGAARVMTSQPRDNIFESSTSKRASSVLSYDQPRASTKSRGRMHDTVLSTSLRLKSTYAWLATIGQHAWLRLSAKPRLKSWRSLVHLLTRRKCATPGVSEWLNSNVNKVSTKKCQLLFYSLGGATQRWYRVIIKLTVNLHV